LISEPKQTRTKNANQTPPKNALRAVAIPEDKFNKNSIKKPVLEGEIMMRVNVKINGEAPLVANVYKGDTSFTVADRIISQQLNKIKVSANLISFRKT
jgi:hypothetical protein